MVVDGAVGAYATVVADVGSFSGRRRKGGACAHGAVDDHDNVDNNDTVDVAALARNAETGSGAPFSARRFDDANVLQRR